MKSPYSDGVFYAHNVIINPFLVSAVAGLQPGIAVDFGCGMGANVAFLRRAGWQVWMVEREEIAVAELRRKFDPSFVIQADLRQLDFNLLPTCDLVTCNYVVQHLTRDEVAGFLRKAVSCLKPNGLFVLSNFQRADAVPFDELKPTMEGLGSELLSTKEWEREDRDHGPVHFHRGVESLWRKRP